MILASSPVFAASSATEEEPPNEEPPTQEARASFGLTAVPGVKVGHFTHPDRPTGCTAVLVEGGAVGAVDIRGGAPGTREVALLEPVNMVSEVHAVVLSGGSAFGLEAATGVVRYLEERGVGYATSYGPVPIVPAAILFDLGVGDAKIRPDAEAGYRAAQAATAGPIAEGSVGAGAGATVGKSGGREGMMKGGVGTSSITLENGLIVAALAAVNAFGDVIDPATGQVVAGTLSRDGEDAAFADARRLLRRTAINPLAARSGENTTLAIVVTNAKLDKSQAQKVAQMAHDGFARAIQPAHMPWDGDIIFSLATGGWEGEVDTRVLGTIGALAAEATAEAIVRAVREAHGVEGIPAVRDLSENGSSGD